MTTYNTFSKRFADQKQKRAAFINQKKAEREKEKSQEFNLINSIVEGGIAFAASGGNPLAAGAAALTAKTGKTDFVGSGIGGVSKGMTIGGLSNAGASAAQAGAAPIEAGKMGANAALQTGGKNIAAAGSSELMKNQGQGYGLNFMQAATDAAKGSMKNPGRAVDALQAFNPNTQLQAIASMQSRNDSEEKKKLEANKLQADAAKLQWDQDYKDKQLDASTEKERLMLRLSGEDLDQKTLRNELSKLKLSLAEWNAFQDENKKSSYAYIDKAISGFDTLIKDIKESNPGNETDAIAAKHKELTTKTFVNFVNGLKGLSRTEKDRELKKLINAFVKAAAIPGLE